MSISIGSCNDCHLRHILRNGLCWFCEQNKNKELRKEFENQMKTNDRINHPSSEVQVDTLEKLTIIKQKLQLMASNRKLMQVSGPAREILNILNPLIEKIETQSND